MGLGGGCWAGKESCTEEVMLEMSFETCMGIKGARIKAIM